MTPKEELEEFDSGWEKNVWDFAIIGNDSDQKKYVMKGPIDFRYCLNYGHITHEHYRFFNCSEYYSNVNDDTTLNSSEFTKETTKKIDIDIQYYFYKNNQSWHYTDFYPTYIEVYKYINKTDNKKKEMYEIALLMENRKYKNILSGPIFYCKNIKHLYFNELQPYIKGDINVLKKYGKCIKKIEKLNNFYSVFNIKFNLNTNKNLKVELWNIDYNKKHKWDHYKSEQKEEKYDIIFITNKQKQIKYILNNVIINVIDGIIKFTGYELYKSGDYEKLNSFGIKIKGLPVMNYKFWLDENNDALISDYAITYKQFVFPNKIKPFKAFLYRFKTLANKFTWKKYKNNFQINSPDVCSIVFDDLSNIHNHIRMDSNMQIIHNDIDIIDNNNNEFENMNSLILDIKSPSVQSIIHPLILSNTNSFRSIECIKSVKSSPPNINNKNYENYEMIINMSNDKWTLTPKKTDINCISPKKHIQLKALELSPYFKGNVKLPPIKSKPPIEVWDFYVAKYGFEPHTITHLMKFSHKSPDVESLKYVEARKQFNARKQ